MAERDYSEDPVQDGYVPDSSDRDEGSVDCVDLDNYIDTDGDTI